MGEDKAKSPTISTTYPMTSRYKMTRTIVLLEKVKNEFAQNDLFEFLFVTALLCKTYNVIQSINSLNSADTAIELSSQGKLI